MTKTRKRRIISSITTLAIVFSLGAANTLDAYDAGDNNEQAAVMLEYDRIEELPDGGKIYVYIIDGTEHQFPVPPEGFKPLTATDEQLETYGFPQRPDEENREDYEEWVELMSNYKFTQAPELEMTERLAEDNTGISTHDIIAGNTVHPRGVNVAGYYSERKDSKFYTQIQGDFVYPNISTDVANSRDSFWIGFGDPSWGKAVCAGITTICTKVGTNSTVPWYGYRQAGNSYIQEFRFSGFKVNAGDNIHIYLSFQKANNKLSYYFANNTTGESKSNVIDYISADKYFDGSIASWTVERRLNPVNDWYYYIADFGTVTFKNCKAMLNTSTSWTNLNSLENIGSNNMSCAADPVGVLLGDIINNNQFSCTWLAGGGL